MAQNTSYLTISYCTLYLNILLRRESVGCLLKTLAVTLKMNNNNNV